MKKLQANKEIREAMKKKGISQFDIAKHYNVCENTIFRMLRNELSEEKKNELLNVIENYELY